MLKKSISLLLCAVLTFSLCLFALPKATLAYAEPRDTIFLCNMIVTDGGYWTVNNAGHLKKAGNQHDYNVHYDPDTNTLTLKNVDFSIIHDFNNPATGNTVYAAVYADMPISKSLIINLIGENKLTCGSENEISAGIYVERAESLTICSSVNGSLEATGGNAGSNASYGVYSSGAISITGGSVTATGGNSTAESYGIYSKASTTTISGGTLEAKGNTSALNNAPVIDSYPTPHTITVSTSTDVTSPSEAYDPSKIDTYKYFDLAYRVSIANLGMIATATENSYYINSGEPGVAGYVNTIPVGQEQVYWNAKLELIDGKYKLTLRGLDINGTAGLKSSGDLDLHIADADRNGFIKNSTGFAIYVNGDLHITCDGTGTTTLNAYSKDSDFVKVTGNLTLDGGCELKAEFKSPGVSVSAINVGGNLTVGAGCSIVGEIWPIGAVPTGVVNRGIKVGGNVVMNGEYMLCSGYSGGIGLDAGGDIRLNSGVSTFGGGAQALTHSPLISDNFSYVWKTDKDDLTYNLRPYTYSDYHKYVEICPAPSAAISNVVVSGTAGAELTPQDAKITLTNEAFKGLSEGTDVTPWFKDKPDGLTAKIKTTASIYPSDVTITFSGVPTETSTSSMKVDIPAENLFTGLALTVATNTDAKWNIAEASVVVTPATASVAKGGTETFAATVSGANSPAASVTWSVSGGVSGTTIDGNGVLSVASNETAASLTVKATSTVDATKFATATVTVTTPEPEPSDSDGSSSDYTPATVTVYNDPVQPKATIWLSSSELTPDDQLITKPNPQTPAFTVMRTIAGKNEVVAAYDISLQSGKKSTGSAMSLTFDLDTTRAGQEFTLVHQKADGTFEYFYAVADSSGKLVFNGIHSLSPFMIVKGRLAQTAYTNLTDMPKTGDSAQPALVTSTVLLMAASSLAGLSLRKRKG